ncbi:unnamed protein product [Cuscuta europaea]|uniref:Uncharacterized protein n=1 Tax=Cuscuta europaea TaxID=41803 RepID=A0A9P0YZQ9_CUSEU|nr:unnamed protein product [Cuscuta europaea]
MEIPDLNMISDFEAGVKCLQNPSFISRSFPISGIERSFWKWGALILALIATFGGILRRLKLFFFYIRTVKPSAEPLLQYLNEDFDFSDEDDDENSSIASSEEDEIRRITSTSFYKGRRRNGGNMRFRRRRDVVERLPAWSGGKSVVKLWDNLALGYDFDEEVISLWDLNKDVEPTNTFPGSNRIPAVTMASPSVVMSSEARDNGEDVIFAAYDTRKAGKAPAICAEWHSRVKNVVDINCGGDEKVYVGDRGAGVLAVGDMRNIKTPLES